MSLTASIQSRLRNQAREQMIPFASILEQFAVGRFLARLSQSQYADQYILKGAQLFRVWQGEEHRPTRDIDFLSYGSPNPSDLEQMFNEVFQITPNEEDALSWEACKATEIRENNSYGGVRVKTVAYLGKVRIPVQVDIGFGDIITPEFTYETWKSVIGFSEVSVRAYPVETVVAEKYEAMVSLGMTNSRMKDFYDLFWIFEHLAYDPKVLQEAITKTFERRKTEFPTETPIPLTNQFFGDDRKNTQWDAFITKNQLSPESLERVCQKIAYAIYGE